MKQTYQLLLISLLLILSIFCYKCILEYMDIKYKNDPLLFNINNSIINGWLISHFIVFMVAGYMYPDHFYFIMLIGICWEFIEMCIGYIKYIPILKNIVYNNSLLGNTLKAKDDNWWYGQYEDIIVNIFGLVIGKYVLPIIVI